MSDEEKYLYGPVPSRRLGLSLGVDIVPYKVCTLDCVYCQIGRTTDLTTERRAYVAADVILEEIRGRVAQGLKADYITIGGSGEPTLNSELGVLVDGIKAMTDIPVALLTNGTLFYRADVRGESAKADVVLPSLDAGDAMTFGRLNRPHVDLSIEKLVDGLSRFRDDFRGRIWLEVFVISPINTTEEDIDRIDQCIGRIRPDKVHLNTAVRPTADPDVKRVEIEQLKAIARKLGPRCEIISDFSQAPSGATAGAGADDVLALLRRRPCSVDDISSGLHIHRHEVLKIAAQLQDKGVIRSEYRNGRQLFMAH